MRERSFQAMQKTEPQIQIRNAHPGDVDAICVLWRELFEFHASLDAIFTPAKDGERHYKRWVLGQMLDPDAINLVVEIDDRIIGYCFAQLQSFPPIMKFRRVGSITDMCIHERYRNLSLGRALFFEMEKRIKAKGVTRLELKTLSANKLSNHFWEEVCGFDEFMKIRFKEFEK